MESGLKLPIKQPTKRVNSTGNMIAPPVPVVNIQPCKTNSTNRQASGNNEPELHHVDSVPNIKQSTSSLSLERGLSASPIPWRDASMEVLVSPNDGPQIAIDELDLEYNLTDYEFRENYNEDFDTNSLGENVQHANLKEGTFASPPSNPGIDKLIDRRFACYGISPKLHRKNNDTDLIITPASKGQRPTSLGANLETQTFSIKHSKEKRFQIGDDSQPASPDDDPKISKLKPLHITKSN